MNQKDFDQAYCAADIAATLTKTENKTPKEIEGQIYTHIRRELNGTPLGRIFIRKKKHAPLKNPEDFKFVMNLARELLMSQPSSDENKDAITELRTILAQMNNAQSRMEQCNQDAKRVAEQLVTINKNLNPHGDEHE